MARAFYISSVSIDNLALDAGATCMSIADMLFTQKIFKITCSRDLRAIIYVLEILL